MRYCFDLDDTISIHKERDYPNAIPINGVIGQIRRLKEIDEDAFIIIHTSRGMNSCNGDVDMAKKRNLPIIEEWIKRYNVPCDEIIFGKPLADVYVDDKAISADKFASGRISRYEGFSGAAVTRVCDMVIKGGEKTKHEYDWYCNDAKAGFKQHRIPKIFSYTLGKLYMEYIDGTLLSDVINNDPLKASELYFPKVRSILQEFAGRKLIQNNNVQEYCSFIRLRAKTSGIDVEPLCEQLKTYDCLRESTFNHGDFTMLNVIVSNKELYLIDASAAPLETWLLDAAKFRASLNGLDAAITGRECNTKNLVSEFDKWFDEIDVIRLLEKSHYVRVMHYAKNLGKEKEFNRLMELYLA